MFLEQIDPGARVFVAAVTDDISCETHKLCAILESAGMSVVTDNGSADEVMSTAVCSVHVLGNTHGDLPEQHFNSAWKRNATDNSFKVFIWQLPHVKGANDPLQEQFVNKVRNNIARNMVFCCHESGIMLVEDMRSMLHEEEKWLFQASSTDIFIIYNEIDEDAAATIIDFLKDVASVEQLGIALNNECDYSSILEQQVEESKLTVIYFKRAAAWALPFIQQVWKNIGGASSRSKILLVGDAGYEQNSNARFDAPNVTSIAVAGELIPLEIKVQLDNLSQLPL